MNRSRLAILALALLWVGPPFGLGQPTPTPNKDDAKAKKSEPTLAAKLKKSAALKHSLINQAILRDLRGLVHRPPSGGGAPERPAGLPREAKVGIAEPILKYLASQASARALRRVTPDEVMESAVDVLTKLQHSGHQESALP